MPIPPAAPPPTISKQMAEGIVEAMKPLTEAVQLLQSGSAGSSAAAQDVAESERLIMFPARQAELLKDTLQRAAFSVKQASELCMKLAKQFSAEAQVLESAHGIVKHMVWEAKNT